MITAIANGELEIANLAYSTFPLAIQNASMDDMRIIADEFQDGVKGHYSNEFYVLTDGPIKKVEDLKGKVSPPTPWAARSISPRAPCCSKHGLEDKRDYTIVEAPFPDHEGDAGGEEGRPGSVGAAVHVRSGAKQISRVLFTSKDAIGVSQFIVWAARKSFIDKNRAAMVDFMEDMMVIERWFMDPKNHDEVMQIAVKVTKVPPERFGWLFTKQDYYRSPDMLPNLDALQSNINTDARAWLHQGAARREEIHRPEPRPGRRQAPEVSVTLSRRMG